MYLKCQDIFKTLNNKQLLYASFAPHCRRKNHNKYLIIFIGKMSHSVCRWLESAFTLWGRCGWSNHHHSILFTPPCFIYRGSIVAIYPLVMGLITLDTRKFRSWLHRVCQRDFNNDYAGENWTLNWGVKEAWSCVVLGINLGYNCCILTCY